MQIEINEEAMDECKKEFFRSMKANNLEGADEFWESAMETMRELVDEINKDPEKFLEESKRFAPLVEAMSEMNHEEKYDFLVSFFEVLSAVAKGEITSEDLEKNRREIETLKRDLEENKNENIPDLLKSQLNRKI